METPVCPFEGLGLLGASGGVTGCGTVVNDHTGPVVPPALFRATTFQ
jgi:hypothetical protein